MKKCFLKIYGSHFLLLQESDHKVPQIQEPQLPLSDEPLEELKMNLNGSRPKDPIETFSHSQWQRSSDLTPEAWQQQVDQRLQQHDTEQQTESWNNRNLPHHPSQQSDSVFKDSKSMRTSVCCPLYLDVDEYVSVQLCGNTDLVKNCCHCYSHDNKKCEVHNNS